MACVHVDSGGTPPGSVQSLDASNVPLPDVWHVGPHNNDFGNAQTNVFFAKTGGLTTGQKIRWTIPGSGVFATIDIAYLTGQTADPQPDGSASAEYGSGAATSTIASGPATGSQKHDAAFGCATAKFGGVNLIQASGFSTPPGQATANSLYVAGTAVDSASTASTFNYQATSLTSQQPASAALLLMTTEPQPFDPKRVTSALPMLQVNTLGLQGAPDVAQAAGLSVNSLNMNVFTASPFTPVDINKDYFLGHTVYLDNNFFQGQTATNYTLNGISMLVGQGNGGYQAGLDTFTAGLGGGTSFVGQAFQPDFYAETTASFPTVNTSPWQAPIWTFTAECMTVTTLPADQWPGEPPGTEICIEIDYEHFMGNFGTNLVQSFFSIHNHWGSAHTNDFQSQVIFNPPGGVSTFYQSKHRYGMKIIHATATVPGAMSFYVDGTLIGSISYTKFSFNVNAVGVVNVGDASITMTTSSPTAAITHGYKIENVRTSCILGTLASFSGPVVALNSTSACAGLAGDPYIIAPPTPPPITSGTYNNTNGKTVVNFGSDPALEVGQTIGFAPNGTGANLSGSFPIIAVGTNTITLQLPASLGAATITGGLIQPPWFYGPVDNQHQAIISGYVDSPNQGTMYDLRVDQSTTVNNLRSF